LKAAFISGTQIDLENEKLIPVLHPDTASCLAILVMSDKDETKINAIKELCPVLAIGLKNAHQISLVSNFELGNYKT
jgi:ribosomal protein L7/L12